MKPWHQHSASLGGSKTGGEPPFAFSIVPLTCGIQSCACGMCGLKVVHIPEMRAIRHFRVHNLSRLACRLLKVAPWKIALKRLFKKRKAGGAKVRTGRSTNSLSKYLTSPPCTDG